MKTIQLKTAMAICLGHMTFPDQSESIKTKNDHVTHKVNRN